MNRFGHHSEAEINKAIKQKTPLNTVKCKNNVWKQFMTFCTDRNYELTATTSDEQLARILKDWIIK